MTPFQYVAPLTSIVIALGITRILTGLGRIVQMRGSVPPTDRRPGHLAQWRSSLPSSGPDPCRDHCAPDCAVHYYQSPGVGVGQRAWLTAASGSTVRVSMSYEATVEKKDRYLRVRGTGENTPE